MEDGCRRKASGRSRADAREQSDRLTRTNQILRDLRRMQSLTARGSFILRFDGLVTIVKRLKYRKA